MRFNTALCLATIPFILSSCELLPGPCPIRQASDNLTEEMQMLFKVIGKVPLSVHFNSYLFGKRMQESCASINFFPSISLIQAVERNHRVTCPIIRGSFERQDSNNFLFHTYHYNISMSPAPRPVGLIVNETVSFWIIGHGAFLSTCREISDLDLHDEALLVLMMDNYYKPKIISSLNLTKFISELQSEITKYFAKELVDRIQWDNERKRSFCVFNNQCMKTITSTRNDIPRRYYLVVVVIFVLFIIGLIFSIYYPIFTCPDKRVHPI